MSRYTQCIVDDGAGIMSDGVLIGIDEIVSTLNQYHEALEKIAYPIKAIQKEAEEQGLKINGAMLVELSNDAEYLKTIARSVL